MKKAAILILLMIIEATADRILWRDEMNCTPFIMKEDYSEIKILDSCSDPVKAFAQWLKDNHPQWITTRYYSFSSEKGWAVFRFHD